MTQQQCVIHDISRNIDTYPTCISTRKQFFSGKKIIYTKHKMKAKDQPSTNLQEYNLFTETVLFK